MSASFPLLAQLYQEVIEGGLELNEAVRRAEELTREGRLDAEDANRADDRARELLDQSQFPQAYVWSRLAVVVAWEAKHPLVLAYSLYSLGQITQSLSRLEEAERALQNAASLFGDLEGHEVDVARCQYTLGQVRQDQNHLDDAANLILEVHSTFQQHKLSVSVARCQYTLGQIRLLQNHLDDAADLIEKAQPTFEQHGLSVNVAGCQLTLGQIRQAQNRLDDAADLVLKAQLTFEQHKLSVSVARCQYTLGQVRRAQNRLDEAADLLLKAQPTFQQHGLSVDVANCQYTLGQIREAQNRLDEAADLLLKAQPTFQQHGLSIDVANCQYTLGQIRRAQNRLDEAADLLLKAQPTFQQHGLSIDVANCQYTLGQIRRAQNRLDEAVDLLLKAQPTFQQHGLSVAVANCQYTLGQIRLLQNHLDDAADLIEKAQPTFEQHGLSVAVANCQYTLGQIRRAQNRLDEAVDLLLKAQPTFQEHELSVDVANCQYTLGQIRRAQNRLDEAADLLLKAQPTFQQHGLSVDVANCQYTLGQIRRAQNRLDEAADLLLKAQPTFQQHGLSIAVANCQYTLGQIRQDQNRLDEAVDLILMTLPTYEQHELSVDVANCQYTLGQIRLLQNHLDDAADLIEKAQPTYEQHGLSVEVARCQHTLGLVRLAQAQSDPANRDSFLAEASGLLLTARELNGAGSAALEPGLARMIPALLARVTTLSSDSSESRLTALDYYDEAISAIEELRSQQVTSEARVSLTVSTLDVYLEAALLAARSALPNRAYRYLLGAKAREARESLGAKANEAMLESLPSVDCVRLEELLADESALEHSLLRTDYFVPGTDLRERGEGENPSPRGQARSPQSDTPEENQRRSQETRDRLASLRVEKKHLLDDLYLRFPEVFAQFGAKPPTPSEVQDALLPGELIIDLLVHEDQAYLFLVAKDHINLVELKHGSRIARLLAEADTHLQPTADREAQLRQALWRDQLMPTTLLNLSNELFDHPSIHQAIAQASTVFFSPASSRPALPWHALWVPGTIAGQFSKPTRLDHAGKPFWILPSAGLLPSLRRAGRAVGTGSGIRRVTAQPNSAFIVVANADPDPERGIPCTALEARFIASIYNPNAHGHLDADLNGSYDALRKAEGLWATLHVSCHGDGNTLLLTDAEGHQVRLTPAGVSGTLKLKAALVVLAACWSGHESSPQAAEWLGLATAFLASLGAQAIVVCLWPVKDIASPFFFRELHQGWAREGLPIGEAMAKARQNLGELTWRQVKTEAGDYLTKPRDLEKPGEKPGSESRKEHLELAAVTRCRGVRDAEGDAGQVEYEPDDRPFSLPNDKEVYLLIGNPSLRYSDDTA